MGIGPSVEADRQEMLDVVGREHGFRVHRVEAGSPGDDAGLQSILDYIVVANGVRLDHDDGSFVRMIQECKDKVWIAARVAFDDAGCSFCGRGGGGGGGGSSGADRVKPL